MPWRQVDVVEQRLQFVIRAASGKELMASLCRESRLHDRPVIVGESGTCKRAVSRPCRSAVGGRSTARGEPRRRNRTV